MIEPKDGEWWMCYSNGAKLPLYRNNDGWSEIECHRDDNYKNAKPLYKMVKDEDEPKEKPREEPKPRTKVVYEPVNKNVEGGAYWECARDFANGVEFASSQDRCNITNNLMLLTHYENRSLCRVVEKEIDWKDELINKMGCGLVKANKDMNGYIVIGGVTFPDEVMIEMCHLVASLTDKPE